MHESGAFLSHECISDWLDSVNRYATLVLGNLMFNCPSEISVGEMTLKYIKITINIRHLISDDGNWLGEI